LKLALTDPCRFLDHSGIIRELDEDLFEIGFLEDQQRAVLVGPRVYLSGRLLEDLQLAEV
jgi:hypothetical protein